MPLFHRIIPADGSTVLLLDEADVFLEERTMADLQRNSLVSGKLQLSQA